MNGLPRSADIDLSLQLPRVFTAPLGPPLDGDRIGLIADYAAVPNRFPLPKCHEH